MYHPSQSHSSTMDARTFRLSVCLSAHIAFSGHIIIVNADSPQMDPNKLSLREMIFRSRSKSPHPTPSTSPRSAGLEPRNPSKSAAFLGNLKGVAKLVEGAAEAAGCIPLKGAMNVLGTVLEMIEVTISACECDQADIVADSGRQRDRL